MSLTIQHLETFLNEIQQNAGNPGVPSHAYVEVGRYKPYHPSIVKAAERRGYRVEKAGGGVFYVYPKAAA